MNCLSQAYCPIVGKRSSGYVELDYKASDVRLRVKRADPEAFCAMMLNSTEFLPGPYRGTIHDSKGLGLSSKIHTQLQWHINIQYSIRFAVLPPTTSKQFTSLFCHSPATNLLYYIHRSIDNVYSIHCASCHWGQCRDIPLEYVGTDHPGEW